MSKIIIITGANGFIGSFLVDECISRGHTPIALVRHCSNTSQIQIPESRIFRCDFGDVDDISRNLNKIKTEFGIPFAVIHNAGVTKTIENADFFKVNVDNTKHLLEALQQFKEAVPRFIFMSSLAAQGPGNPDTMKPISWDDQSLPDTLYGISKLEAEKIIQNQKTFPWIILRPTGVYGPKDKDYLMVLKTVKSGLAPLLGYQTQYLSFIYVKDLVRVVLDATNSSFDKKTYIIAGEQYYTSEQYNDLLKKYLNPSAKKIRIPFFLVEAVASVSEGIQKFTRKPTALNMDKFRTMKALNWKCNIEPIQHDLQFREEYPLERGLEECIHWYRKHGWL